MFCGLQILSVADYITKLGIRQLTIGYELLSMITLSEIGVKIHIASTFSSPITTEE